MAAAAKLADQTLAQATYAGVARDSDWVFSGTRAVAVAKLTDQSLIADIAKTDSSSVVRSAAVRMLTDQVVLADVAKRDEDRDVREATVETLTDQALLAEVAKTAADVARAGAVKKLIDQSLVAERVL